VCSAVLAGVSCRCVHTYTLLAARISPFHPTPDLCGETDTRFPMHLSLSTPTEFNPKLKLSRAGSGRHSTHLRHEREPLQILHPYHGPCYWCRCEGWLGTARRLPRARTSTVLLSRADPCSPPKKKQANKKQKNWKQSVKSR
jgi:hypothetical protein